MYHIASLVLGIGAWAFGVLAIKAPGISKAYKRSGLSFSLCAVSVLLQLMEISRRVSIGDLSAVMDTIGAIVLAASLLIGVTVILNAVAVIKATNKLHTNQ